VKLNREQGLFLVVLLLALALGWFRSQSSFRAVATPSGPGFEIPVWPEVPGVTFIPADEVRFEPGGRDVFAPPRPWNPLPLLAIPLPPLPEIGAIGALPEPGVLPESVSRFRRPPPAQGVGVSKGAGDSGSPDPGTGPVGDDLNGADDSDDAGVGWRDSTYAGIDFGSDEQSTSLVVPGDEDLERLYDWIRRPDQRRVYGMILSEDKIALIDNASRPIEFQQFDARTGRPLSKASFNRADLEGGGAFETGFGFADTVRNRTLLLWREVRPAATNVQNQLQAGERCLKWVSEDREAALKGAERFARSALGFDPANAAGYALLGRVFELNYDLEGELEVIRTAVEAGAVNSRILTRKGMLLFQLGLPVRAEESLLEAVGIERDDPIAWHELGRVRLAMERPADALKALDAFEHALRAVNLDAGRKSAVLVDQARAHLLLGNTEDVERSLDRALNTGADAADAWNIRGVMALMRGDFKAARGHFKAALETEPGHRNATYNDGIVLAWTSDDGGAASFAKSAEAHARFAQAADLGPLTAFWPTVARGIIEEARGDDEQASTWFDMALELSPGRPFGLYRSGRNARRLGNLDTAASLLSRALVEHGRITDVLNELGMVSLLMDAPADAVKYFDESLRREPGHVAIRVVKAMALLRLNDLDEALALFEESSQGDTNAAALCGAAWCLYRLGREDEALAQFAAARAAAGSEIDPFRIYADTWQQRLDDHRNKEQWVDAFDREQLKNGWEIRESVGPTVVIGGQGVVIQGNQRAGEDGGLTEIRRPLDGATIVLFEADVTLEPLSEGAVGVGIVYERPRAGGELTSYGEISVARFGDGSVRLFVRDGKVDVPHDWTVLEGVRLEAGEPALLTIERTDYETGTFQVRVNEKVVASGIEVASLRRFNKTAQGTVFTRALGREKVGATIDGARIIRYRQ